MAAVGVGLAYLGYCGVLWGVFLVTGKNVGVKQLFGKDWPPKVPGASATASTTSGTTSTSTTLGTSATPLQNGTPAQIQSAVTDVGGG